MRIKLAAAAVAAFAVAAAAPAVAEPGPNGHNNHGLCTAYFNGSDQGKENKREAGPFAALEEAADDGDDSTSPEEDVRVFCEGLIGGKPENRG